MFIVLCTGYSSFVHPTSSSPHLHRSILLSSLPCSVSQKVDLCLIWAPCLQFGLVNERNQQAAEGREARCGDAVSPRPPTRSPLLTWICASTTTLLPNGPLFYISLNILHLNPLRYQLLTVLKDHQNHLLIKES